MALLKAIREVRYAGETRYPGDTFEASDKDAKLLKAIGKAEYGGEPSNKTDLPKRVKQPTKEVAEAPAPLSGTYLRRDMVATGQTGGDNPAPSSRRGRPPKVQALPYSEDDAE